MPRRRCRVVPGSALPPRSLSGLSLHHSASCAGAAHGALRGARTLEAGLPAARGKVELGEVGSGGGAPRGGHREVAGSARGFRRIRGDPETPGTRNPELAGKQIGGGGGGPRRRGELETRAPREWKWRKGRRLGRKERGLREREGWGGEWEYLSETRSWGPPFKSYLKPGCRAPCYQEGVVSGSCCLQLAPSLQGGFQTTLFPRNLPVLGLPRISIPRISQLESGALKAGWRVRSGQEVRQKGEQLGEDGKEEPEV